MYSFVICHLADIDISRLLEAKIKEALSCAVAANVGSSSKTQPKVHANGKYFCAYLLNREIF